MEPKEHGFPDEMFGLLDNLQVNDENREKKHCNGQIAADAILIDVGNLIEFVIDVAVLNQVYNHKCCQLV
jgi:hypothetical protein